MSLPYALRALRSSNFRRYYFGQTISQLGSWMQSVAIMWLAYRLTNSTTATGTIGFLALIPFLFVTPIAGALSDRVSRRKLLMVVQTIFFFHAATLAVMTYTGHMTVNILGMFAFIGGTLSALEVTTRHSFFVQLVEDRTDLPNAIALNSANINATRLIGPAVGGLLIAAVGEAACFGINAVSYLAVVYQLSRIKPNASGRISTGQSLARDLIEGWRIALTSPIILPLVLIVGLVSFAINPYSILMPAIAVETFGKGAELHGIFVSAVGIGALTGAILLARRENVRGLSRWVAITASIAAAGAVLFSVFASMQNTTMSIIGMALVGMGLMGTSATVNTIIQTVVDDDKRGRVVSVYSTFFAGGAPLGHVFAGWTAAQFGAPLDYMMLGIICAIGAAAFAFNLPNLKRHLRAAYLDRGIIPPAPASAATLTASESPQEK
ncbi:MAG: MFS transporter [Burkholderiales bacterium]